MLSESYKKMIGLISREEEEEKHYPYETELKDVCIIQVNFSQLQNQLQQLKILMQADLKVSSMVTINRIIDSLK